MATDKLATVRKLLAKADGAGTPAEAQAYAEAAAAMMARHGIDEALARAAAPAEDPIESKVIRLGQPYTHERGHLLWAVARGMGCRAPWGKSTATIHGHRSDIARAELLYTQLLMFVAGPMTAPVESATWCWTAREAAAETRRWRKSWLTGFARGIEARMMAERRTATAEAETRSTGAELVLADRSAAVERYVEEKLGKVRTHAPRKLDADAVRAGRRAAASADLGRTRVGGGAARRALS